MTEAESKEGREGGEHWSTTPERRGMWGLRLLWLLYRIGAGLSLRSSELRCFHLQAHGDACP